MNSVTEEPWISDIEYGGIAARNMWAESKNDQASALYLDANFETAFKIDDISSVFHYELIPKYDGLSSNMTGEEKAEYGVFDGLLCEDEITSLPLAICFPNASEDQILDVDFTKKVPELDFKFCDELTFGNSRSDIMNSPGFSNEAIGFSVSSTQVPKSLNNQFTKSTSTLHDVFKSKCGVKTPVEDNMRLECFEDRLSVKCSFVSNTQDVHETNEEKYFQHDEVIPVIQCIKAENYSMDDLSNNSCSESKSMGGRHRRLCKPPQKYTENSLWLKPRRGRPRKYPPSSMKDLGVRSQKKNNRKRSERKASKRGGNLELDSDEEYKPKFERRKKSKYWKLDEIVKLVDGIAHFGQGEWTAIQRAFFSSSCRTPTDIRDKWRNLVNTNSNKLKRKRKDEHLRSGTLSLPRPVLERVRELASVIPKCRMKRGQKVSDGRCYDTCPSLLE